MTVKIANVYSISFFCQWKLANKCKVFTIYMGISAYMEFHTELTCITYKKQHMPACTITPKRVCTRMVSYISLFMVAARHKFHNGQCDDWSIQSKCRQVIFRAQVGNVIVRDMTVTHTHSMLIS